MGKTFAKKRETKQNVAPPTSGGRCRSPGTRRHHRVGRALPPPLVRMVAAGPLGVRAAAAGRSSTPPALLVGAPPGALRPEAQKREIEDEKRER